MKSNHTKLVVAAMLAGIGFASQAAVLTFEAIPGGTGVNSSSSIEAGFDLVVSGLFLDAGGNGAGGSANELEGLCCASGGNLNVKKTGGGTFTFASIDVEREYFDGGTAAVTVQGYLGGILQSTDVLFSSGAYVTDLAFNLAGVTVDELVVTGQRDFNAGASFDNLTLGASAVPIPGTLALLLPSLLALGLTRKRHS